ncbi:MAG: hypothetical protein ABIO16_17350 [Nocardioides sp.]
MRLLGTALVVALLGLLPAPADAASGCRHQWMDLTSLHGENGNPEGSAIVLVERWDAMYAHGVDMEEDATPADCGDVIAGFARQWDGLELLMYGLHEFDMPLQLAIDEGDRKHWVALQQGYGQPGVLPDWLHDAFHRLRRQAPRSYAVLADVLAGAGDVPVGRQRRVAAFLDEVAAVANADQHYALAQRADELIDSAELSEE